MHHLEIAVIETPEDQYRIKCPYSMEPIGITVHNTGNCVSARNEISYMLSNNNEVSYHFAVDDIEAIQGIPLDRNAWHAGDGNGPGNRSTIAVEICYSTADDESLFAEAEENAALLCAMLCRDYGWTTDNVKRHYDYAPNHKYCPHKTMDWGWERFLAKVQEYMDELEADAGSSTQTENNMTRSEAENYVATDYIEFLNRLPDAGAQMYVDYLVDGGDAMQVDAWIKESEEYNTPYSNDNYKRWFVIKCYDICLGRFPESEDVICEHMKADRLRDIFDHIYNSEEAKKRRG